MKQKINKINGFSKFIPLGILILVSLFFGILYPRFFSIPNVLNLIRQMSPLMIVSMGMTIVILMGSIDASIGANVTFCGVVGALLAPSLGLAAVFVSLLAGACVGLLNGVLVTKVKVPSFLVTLSLMGALNGVALLLMHSSPVNIQNQGFLNFSDGSVLFSFPNIDLIPIIIVIISYYFIKKTSIGRSFYAIGGNEKATFYSGIKVRQIQILAFVISGIMAGIAGSLQASMYEAACPYQGESLLMNSIAAVAIGGTQLSGGVGGPLETVFGVVLITVIGSGMNFMGLSPATRQIVTGTIMIIAVAINIDRSKMAFVK